MFTLTVAAADEPAAEAFVEKLCPAAKMTYSLGGTLKYELPTTDITAARVFQAMHDAKAGGLAVRDWAVSNATLEEVFIKFARSRGIKMGDSS